MKNLILISIFLLITGVMKSQEMRSESNITISSDTFIFIDSKLAINAGMFDINQGASLIMGDNRNLSVNSGGYLNLTGTDLKRATISSPGYFSFEINAGGTIAAQFALFERMGSDGINIKPGAIIDPLHPFNYSTLRNGQSTGTLMTINNNQDLVINEANFPANSWGGASNVSKTLNSGHVTFINASGGFAGTSYENDPYNIVDWTGSPATQNITIPAGWSGLSSYVMPSVRNLPALMSPLAGNLIVMQTLTGFYEPSTPVNTIGDWMSQSAYKIKLNSAATIPFPGNAELDKTYDMSEGWSLMPVICNTNITISTLVDGLGVNLQIIKEVAGTKVYWPAYGIYTLSQLTPGKAYFVRMAAPGSVTFPNNIADNGFIEDEPIRDPVTPWNTINRTAGSHIIGIDALAMTDMLEGDIIGIFTTSGLCVGNTLIGNTSQNQSVYAFADDQFTAETDGFTDDQPIIFRLFRPSSGEEFTLEVSLNPEMPDHDGMFRTEGISAIHSISAMNTGIEQTFASGFYIYPNPTNGKVTIGGITGIEQVLVMSAEGTILMRLNTKTEGDQVFDLSHLAPGFYQLQLRTSHGTVTKKVVKGL